jgi:hypothetical protein
MHRGPQPHLRVCCQVCAKDGVHKADPAALWPQQVETFALTLLHGQVLQLLHSGWVGVRLTLLVVPKVNQEATESAVGLLLEGVPARGGGGAAETRFRGGGHL